MKKIILIIIIISISSCQLQKKSNKYSRWVGDIEKNKFDDLNFELCNDENRIMQYFNNSQGIEYLGEKNALIKEYQKFIPSKKENQNGIIRIRFIVNCKGEAGRFRIMEADENFKEFKFDKKITKQLLKITKQLKGWQSKIVKNKEIDYYQYLIFKIENGKIKEILP